MLFLKKKKITLWKRPLIDITLCGCKHSLMKKEKNQITLPWKYTPRIWAESPSFTASVLFLLYQCASVFFLFFSLVFVFAPRVSYLIHTKTKLCLFSRGFRVLEVCVQTINIQKTPGDSATHSSDVNCKNIVFSY